MSRVSFDFSINANNLVDMVADVCNDGYCLRDIHRLLAVMTNDYLPFDKGALTRSVSYSKNGVTYSVPYAHYVYEGIVYGPNISYVDKTTGEVKWTSPTKPKYNTGREMNYQTSGHPKATGHWDQVMMEEKGDEFVEGVREILQRRLNKLYG